MVRVREDEEQAALGLGVVVDHEIDGRAAGILAVECDVKLVVGGVEGKRPAGDGDALDVECRAIEREFPKIA
jgi:hypothetical protein